MPMALAPSLNQIKLIKCRGCAVRVIVRFLGGGAEDNFQFFFFFFLAALRGMQDLSSLTRD